MLKVKTIWKTPPLKDIIIERSGGWFFDPNNYRNNIERFGDSLGIVGINSHSIEGVRLSFNINKELTTNLNMEGLQLNKYVRLNIPNVTYLNSNSWGGNGPDMNINPSGDMGKLLEIWMPNGSFVKNLIFNGTNFPAVETLNLTNCPRLETLSMIGNWSNLKNMEFANNILTQDSLYGLIPFANSLKEGPGTIKIKQPQQPSSPAYEALKSAFMSRGRTVK